VELVEQLLKAFYKIHQDPKYLNTWSIPGIVLAVKADVVNPKDLPDHRSSLFRQKINQALQEMIDEGWIKRVKNPKDCSDYIFGDCKEIICNFWSEFSEEKMEEEMKSSWDEENQWFRLTAQGKKHAIELAKGRIAPGVREKNMSKKLEKVNPNTLFDLLKFHPRIKKASEKLFKDSHYAQAILEAFKTVNNFVKEKSGKQEWDGKDLMAKVFRKENPIIRFNKLETMSDKDEQEGFMFLFMGAMYDRHKESKSP